MRQEDVIALIRAHARGDGKHFHDVARMIAANAAGTPRGKDLARRIRDILDVAPAGGLKPLPKGRDGGDDLLEVRPARLGMGDLILAPEVAAAVWAVYREHAHGDALEAAGLTPACKVLFDGPPGTGKTSAAGALARLLDRPFVVARHERIVTSYMGDTAKNMGRVLDFARENECVLLVDEFDSFGRARSSGGSSAENETNRLLNVLLQLLDRHAGPAVIVCATNLPDVMDAAMPRRFDYRVTFALPTDAERRDLIRRTIGDDDGPYYGSQAEVVRECLREKKRRVLAACGEPGPEAQTP